jgi:hypothetical protein
MLKKWVKSVRKRLLRDYVLAVRQQQAAAMIRFGLRALAVVFLAAFKWTIPLAVLFLVRWLN